MIGEPSKYFKDKDFPIYINYGRTSVIDKLEDGKCEIHEALEIKYFYEGRCTLLIGNETVVAKAGDVIIINPYEFHATISCSEERARYHLIMVGLDFFPTLPDLGTDLRTLLFSENKAFVKSISDSEELRTHLTSAVTEYVTHRSAYKLKIRGLMLEVLAILLRRGLIDSPNVGSEQRIRYHITIEPALKKIRNDFKSNITLDELADICCINKYHFCRIFKEAMGISPMQYLCDYRLNNADIMLRNTTRSISDIISDSGFNDESYFYRCYKKHFGETPHSRRLKHLIKS